MKQIFGVIIASMLFLSSCTCPTSNDGGGCDSNAIIIRYLKANNLLTHRSFIPQFSGQTQEYIKTNQSFDVYKQVAFLQRAEYFTAPPTMAAGRLTNYMVKIDKQLANTMITSFQEKYALADETEKNSFFIDASKLSAYINETQAQDIQIIPALFEDEADQKVKRTFIVVAVRDQQHIYTENDMVYEHLLPCPPDANCQQKADIKLR